MTWLSAILAALATMAMLFLLAARVSQRWGVALSALIAVLVFQVWKLARDAGHADTAAWAAAAVLAASGVAWWRTKGGSST